MPDNIGEGDDIPAISRDVLKSTESSAVPTCSHCKNDPVGTDLQGESIVNKGRRALFPLFPVKNGVSSKLQRIVSAGNFRFEIEKGRI
jgi:hypothetical protein